MCEDGTLEAAPAHALQQDVLDLRGFVPGVGEEPGFAGQNRMKGSIVNNVAQAKTRRLAITL